jgi:hypothetical protein
MPPAPPTLTTLTGASAQALPLQAGAVHVATASPAATIAAAHYYSTAAAAALSVNGATAQHHRTDASIASSQACGPLTVDKLAAAAVNYTVMLMVTDASTAHDLLHHWLGNVQAAGIGYYLIAAADDATSQLLVERGLQERCGHSSLRCY